MAGGQLAVHGQDAGAKMCAVIYGVASWALLLPSLAVQVRRLHDTGRSGTAALGLWLFGFLKDIVLKSKGYGSIILLWPDRNAAGMPKTFAVVVVAASAIYAVWFVWLQVCYCKAGTVGENEYGADPKAGTIA